ncbi:MAG: PAS domain-containing protein [Ferrovibrio sp.]|uniref:PAS domain-containing protein n=1 Tax=Ferrovibrio sp. TaxID=1917215 RepID=UPI00261BBDAD|nr:PAS domain-containing protein [Ferrovibrio sp.]MCW0232591.1 PAS domain-containing protein [Ferrovibrio sp.]
MLGLTAPTRFSFCARCSDQRRQHCGSNLLRLYDYWDGKRGTRAFPARRDIDPIELGGLLPHVFLIDVLLSAPYFRYRLAGTGVDKIHGQSLTGKTPSDIRTPEIAAGVEAQYSQVVADRRPRCDHVMLLAADQSFWHYERLILPLSDDGATINMLFCGIYET